MNVQVLQQIRRYSEPLELIRIHQFEEDKKNEEFKYEEKDPYVGESADDNEEDASEYNDDEAAGDNEEDASEDNDDESAVDNEVDASEDNDDEAAGDNEEDSSNDNDDESAGVNEENRSTYNDDETYNNMDDIPVDKFVPEKRHPINNMDSILKYYRNDMIRRFLDVRKKDNFDKNKGDVTDDVPKSDEEADIEKGQRYDLAELFWRFINYGAKRLPKCEQLNENSDPEVEGIKNEMVALYITRASKSQNKSDNRSFTGVELADLFWDVINGTKDVLCPL